KIRLGMVSQVPLDYMHLVCLGVTKRLLQFWVKGRANIRLKEVDLISESFVNMKKSITVTPPRTHTQTREVDNWKATEFRQFLLYSGPILLLNRLPNIYYEHFVSLSVALRILIDSELCFKLNKYAESLLVWFVKFYGDLYGEEFLSYNVHNLIHLAADVKELGSLDKFSAFKFENFMQEIKHKLQNSGNYLQQFVNRLREEMCLSVTYENSKKYPIIFYCKNNVQIVDYIQFDGFTISKSKYDNCILLHNGMYGIVNDITVIDNNCELCINRFSKSEPFFSLPCDSRKHGIAIIDLKEIQKVTISVKSIKRKCIMFDYSKYKYVFLPLLHSD
ncbi:hypothetical protein PPYR_15499, partial [Photinus pyralis]